MQMPTFFFLSNLNWVQSPWRSLILCHHNEAAAISVPVMPVYTHILMHIHSQMHTGSLHTQRAALSQIISHLFDHFESLSQPQTVNVGS